MGCGWALQNLGNSSGSSHGKGTRGKGWDMRQEDNQRAPYCVTCESTSADMRSNIDSFIVIQSWT